MYLIYRVKRLVLSCYLKGRKIKDIFIDKIYDKNNIFNVCFIICISVLFVSMVCMYIYVKFRNFIRRI